MVGRRKKPERMRCMAQRRGLYPPSEECMDCLRDFLRKQPGIFHATVHSNASGYSVEFEYDPQVQDLAQLGRLLGSDAVDFDEPRNIDNNEARLPAPYVPHVLNVRAWWQQLRSGDEFFLVCLSFVLLILGTLVHLCAGPSALRYGLLVASAVAASTRTAPEAWTMARAWTLDVDILMFVAAAGATYLGHPEEGALLLLLFGAGAAGENKAMDRARAAIHALAQVAPETAERLIDQNLNTSTTETVPVSALEVGDRVLVRPFDRIPADAIVEDGVSAVNQAPITGESMPVDKAKGDHLFAATMNGEGRLLARVTKLAHESTLARILRLVEEAQAAQSPTQMFTQRVERWYVPGVFLAAGLLLVLPPWFFGQLWEVWFYRAVAFLTAASPCALAIGTPAAVLCGIARAASWGVLIKGGVHLENLGRVQAMGFDKTGTLTRGRPMVTDIVSLGDLDNERVLGLAASIEVQVNHPLAAAIVAQARRNQVFLEPAHDVRQVAGQGAEGVVAGETIAVGKSVPLQSSTRIRAAAEETIGRLARQGKTAVVVSRGSEPIGLLGLADEPHPEAAKTIARLGELGVRPIVLLTGDRTPAAAYLANLVGIAEFYAELLPEEKTQRLEQLTARHGITAMVGDGVNDAPALARATVGIAMGAAGADVAMESADVVLMGNDLSKLPDAVALSKFTRRLIFENLIIALGVIAIVAPLAASGWANLGLAVFLHEGSTVLVVLNALRILGFPARAATSTGVRCPVCPLLSVNR